MNIGLLLSGIAALAIGFVFEVLIRISKSKVWWRARVLTVLGILLIVASYFSPQDKHVQPTKRIGPEGRQ